MAVNSLIKEIARKGRELVDPEFRRYQETLEYMSTQPNHYQDDNYFQSGVEFETNRPEFTKKGSSYEQMQFRQGSAYLPALDNVDPLEARYVQMIFDATMKEAIEFRRIIGDPTADPRVIFHPDLSFRGFWSGHPPGHYTINPALYSDKPLSILPRRPLAKAAEKILEESPEFESVKDSWMKYR